ncbi:hypothetical protein ACSSIN_002466 [Enterococcus faecalis]|uniref:hypothetical protein n=1 Tax=Enterococcus faecalis TaxID=1351 RepID=UPI000CF09D6C|nr:hypothetical protein [Enterococcus faecalis]EJJ1463578.1 hypothetical protein [Enterococcus faecalis]EME5462976.1 hypothetical protein [Enterococcus faecalis]PQC42761.1 hypothetical protein CUM89_10780 [Enterococcus faecalis]PQF95675.1 hypothetical protein CUS50_14790 [Enterococcus faecalis]ROX69232.1 hypothetical protein EGW20_08145 [Enterococcus faecalis]
MTSIFIKFGQNKKLMATIILDEEATSIKNIYVDDEMKRIFSVIWPAWENKSHYKLETLFQYYFNEMESGRKLLDYILEIKYNGNEFYTVYEPALSISVAL